MAGRFTHRSVVKLIQTGDSHIDTTVHGGINPLTGKDRAVESNLRALRSAVQAALDNDVQGFLHSGDAFATGRPSIEAILSFVEILAPLAHNGIPILLLGGNHEQIRVPANHRTATTLVAEMLGRVGEVHLIEQEPGLVTLSTGAQIVGLPWLSKASLLNAVDELSADPAAGDRLVVEQALARIEKLVLSADETAPLVFTAHATVDDASLDAAERRGSEMEMAHLFSEPVLPLRELRSFGFAFGGLSHIHTRQKVGDGFYYAGSTNRFTAMDAGKDKKVTLVTLGEGPTKVAGIPTDARPMARIDVAADNIADILDGVDEQALVDLTLPTGETEVPAEVLAALAAKGARTIKVRRRPSAIAPAAPALDVLPEHVDPVAALPRYLAARGYSDVAPFVAVAHEITGKDSAA